MSNQSCEQAESAHSEDTAPSLSKEYIHQIIISLSAHIYVTEVTKENQLINRYLSPNVEQLTGYPHRNFINDWQFWPMVVIHPDDRALAAAQAKRLQMGEDSDAEYRLVKADGKVIWVRDSGRVERQNDSKIIYGVVSDITERKQAEAALRKEKEFSDALINSLPGIFYLYDEDLQFLRWNSNLEAVSGYSAQDLAAMGPLDFVDEKERADIAKRIKATFTIEQPTSDDLDLVTKEGRKIPYTFTGSPIISDGTHYNIAIGLDVSAQQQAKIALEEERALLAQRVAHRTAELSKANAELLRATKLKDEFLANMSHELRTPLNAILGMSEVLREGVYGILSKEQLNVVKYIDEGGSHLLSLINDILDLSKIEAGKLELQSNLIEVETLCQASLRFINQIAQKNNIKVSVSIAPHVTLIRADERRLKQVLVNLLTNAVKFTPEGGQVGLDVRENENGVQFIVWDTGIGVSDEDMPHLFKPFVQLDGKFSRKHEGTGLGLALVARLVELHGGSITVESQIGVGSRFTISLPSTQDKAEPDKNVAENLADPRTANSEQAPRPHSLFVTPPHYTILLAEDNEANIATVSSFLAREPYRIIVARNGQEAIDRVLEEEPDLILMDIQMPVLDGLTAIKKIRANKNLARIPIIVLTALAMSGDKERCLDAGADDYLSKPVSRANLLATIAERLKNR